MPVVPAAFFTVLVLLGMTFRDGISLFAKHRGCKDVYAVLYGGFGNFTTDTCAESQDLLQHPHFNRSLPVVIFLHGYNNRPTSNPLIQELRKAFVKRSSHNFVLIDWSKASNRPYLVAVSNMWKVAQYVAQYVRGLIQGGSPVWIVGFSLGAQMAGHVARLLPGIRLHRITGAFARIVIGLDPAGPMFWWLFLPSLSKELAEFVDVIHTNGKWLGFGVTRDVGHQDFWPNSGMRVQPGCPSTKRGESCSHRRAIEYFTESVLREESFPSVRCIARKAFLNGSCKPSIISYMGYAATRKREGRYYLITDEKSPYGIGQRGLYSTDGYKRSTEVSPNLTAEEIIPGEQYDMDEY